MKYYFRPTQLFKLRMAVGETQYEFGKRIGLPPQYISMYETGKSAPRIQTMLKIIDEFDLAVDYFFTNKIYHGGK